MDTTNKSFKLIADGNLEALKQYLDPEVDINRSDKNGVTLLMIAIQYRQREVARWLLSNGANVQLRNNDGATALHWAVEYAQNDLVKLLIDHYADLNDRTRKGKTALMLAARDGYSEIVSTLIDANANITLQDRKGKTALLYASMGQHCEIAKLLLDANIDLHRIEDISMNTPLMKMVEHEALSCIELIWDLSDLSTINRYGETLLHIIADTDQVSLMEKILNSESCPDINHQDQEGYSALMVAAERSTTDLINLLVRAGADLSLKNQLGETAIDIANKRKSVDVGVFIN